MKLNNRSNSLRLELEEFRGQRKRKMEHVTKYFLTTVVNGGRSDRRAGLAIMWVGDLNRLQMIQSNVR